MQLHIQHATNTLEEKPVADAAQEETTGAECTAVDSPENIEPSQDIVAPEEQDCFAPLEQASFICAQWLLYNVISRPDSLDQRIFN